MEKISERIKEIANVKDVTVDYKPTTLKIEACGRCTLSCKYCIVADNRLNCVRQHVLSVKEFRNIMSFVESHKDIFDIKEVGLFYMGESGMNPKLDVMYKDLKDHEYFTYLTTNATYITNIIRAIPYIDSLKVSWNYKNLKDFMNKTMSSAMLYEAIIKNIKVLSEECKKYNTQYTFSTILDNDKPENVVKGEYYDILNKLHPYFDEHYWLPLQSQGGFYHKDEAKPGVLGTTECSKDPKVCWSLFKGLYIDCDMNVRTCCFGYHDDQILMNKTDIVKNRIPKKAIAKMKRIRQAQLNGEIPEECKHCLSK